MAFSYTEAQKVLKEDYKELIEQLSDDVFMLAQIERKREAGEGLRAYHALHVSRNGGIGARETGGTLPTAGNQGYTNALVPLRKFYGSIKVERQLMKLTASDSGAFVRAVDSEMSQLKNDVEVDQGRQVWGTSDGVVASTGVTGASTTVVLATATTATQIRQLGTFIGRLIDIGTVASPTAVTTTSRTLVSINETAKTLVISGAAVTTAVTDRIFFAGNGGTSSNSGLQNDGQKELTGLQTIVAATGILHAVDPSSYPVWKSYVDSNSGTNRAITETMITKAIQAAQVASGGAVDLLVSNAGVFNAVGADMRAMRRNQDTVALKAGFSGVAFTAAGEGRKGATTRALAWDRDCPNNKLFGITTADLVNYEASAWEWIDEDGNVLLRSTNGGRTDYFEAELARYHDVAARRRNSHFLISDVSEV